MIFSSIFFLYFFLPVTLLAYWIVGAKGKNLLLLAASLIFYAWGEVGYVLLMLSSITFNWLSGLLLEKTKTRLKLRKAVLTTAIVFNLLPLLFFKYGNFIAANINEIGSLLAPGMPSFGTDPIHLPIGISFFTFQAMSYVIDVYRGTAQTQSSFINLSLYIALFPQLIAGPIVRYHDVAKQIVNRTVLLADFREGVQRFVTGLAKKVLIANNIGAFADHVFSLSPDLLPAPYLWLGMLCYTLQIYFDFSGYSDMAIGLGRMFGFRFLENFNFPYSARSIQEFWRKWHISLSRWFRDYLYIPLGGNRAGAFRTQLNLLIVFFLCGLWHGASWNFVIWGLYHGFFLILERGRFATLLGKTPRILQHLYTMLIVSIGWVFFRAETLEQALNYLSHLFVFSTPPYLDAQLFASTNGEFYIALICGLVFSLPLSRWVEARLTSISSEKPLVLSLQSAGGTVLSLFWTTFVIVYSSAQLISGSHNPFLYFRF